METKKINDLCFVLKKAINPIANKYYEVYSLPGFDNNKKPEHLIGEEIKSNKFCICSDIILFNKLNVKNKRVWNIHSIDELKNNVCSTEFIPLKTNSNINQDYLYYYLISNELTETMIGSSNGTSNSQQRIRPDMLLNKEILLPSLLVQRKIASILGSIDAKIELNNRMNENLLVLSLTLFGSYIDGKENNGCIGDYCTVKSGYAFKSTWWTDDGIKVVKIADINQDRLSLNSCSHVGNDKYEVAKNFELKSGDLIIAMTGATIGKFAFVANPGEKILTNQRVGKFFLGDNPLERLPYLYCTLKQPGIFNEILNRGGGSAQPNISGGDIMSIPCVILEKEEINDFNQKGKTLFEEMIKNQIENKYLSDLRDTLLPKLMSGEIDVDSIEI